MLVIVLLDLLLLLLLRQTDGWSALNCADGAVAAPKNVGVWSLTAMQLQLKLTMPGRVTAKCLKVMKRKPKSDVGRCRCKAAR